jgi:hypothetical protein
MGNEDMEKKGADSTSRYSPGSMGVALLLILLGVFFLLQRVSDFSLQNWWALFILIPTFSAFSTAFSLWQRSGRFSFGVWSTFYGGLFPLLVALMFLLNLSWGRY